MRRRWRRELSSLELMLTVAEVFPHEEGQEAWWLSYDGRDARGRAELVADLRKRQEQNRAAGA